MAPRTGPRVKVISPNSGTVTTLSRSVSAASSSAFSGSAPASPSTSYFLRRNNTTAESSKYSQRSNSYNDTYGGGAEHAAGAFTPPPPLPHSGRAVLGGLSLNTAAAHAVAGKKTAAVATTAKGRSELSALSPQQQQRQQRSHVGHYGAASRLPDCFAEAEQRRAVHAAPSRFSPSHSSLSRSVSRSGRVDCVSQQRQRGRAARKEEDDEAIDRARAALEHAGASVLRRPFFGSATTTTTTTAKGSSGSHKNSSAASASAVIGGNTASLPRSGATTPTLSPRQHRGLRLPPSISITRADSRSGEVDVEDDRDGCDDDNDGHSNGSRSLSRKRSRSWRVDAAENASVLLARRHRQEAQAHASPRPGSSFASQYYSSILSSKPHSSAAAVSAQDSRGTDKSMVGEATRVCPGMFSGASAIALDPRLFDGVDCGSRRGEHGDRNTAGSAAEAAARHAQPQQFQQRYCVRPLWSLVGTFKTSLSGLVAIDLSQDCLRWHQRNPKGGQQCITVPLSLLVDVFTTQVVQEDERVEERQFTVVVRTSTRPSQVVFGFATAKEANHMRSVLKSPYCAHQ